MTGWAEVAERIEEGDAAGVVAAFAELSEAERRSLAADALSHYKRDELNAVAGLAVLATGTRAEVDRLWAGVPAREPDASVEILADRRPSWLESWVTALCERQPHWGWAVAHGLRLRGLYAGDSPAYALAFIAGIAMAAGRERKPIDEVLLADASLLDDELWDAFRIEGGGETSFAAHDKYTAPDDSWSAGLRRLAEQGAVDRARLIDATLDALARGYSAFRAGWFVRFHDELELTDEERRERLDAYLGLLGSPTAQVQSFAVKAVAALDKADPLPEVRLVRALQPAMLNRAKATASQALRLVDAAAARAEDAASIAARVAAEGLLHEAPDVQERALGIVEQHGDAADLDLAAALEAAAPVVAPSLRSRLAALSGDRSGTAADVAPPVSTRDWPESILDADVLDAVQPVAPIQTTEELAVAVARALEHPEEIDELERALDGISRLCGAGHAAPAAIWAPMRKRAERHLREHDPFAGGGPATDFAALVAAWLDREPPRRTKPPLTVMGFLSLRLHAIARRAAEGLERALLSAPTHTGGWVDPEVLVARLAAESDPIDAADLVLALLRLAPDRRRHALATATGLTGETGAAVRFALGGDAEAPHAERELWVAAARARCPGQDAPDLGGAFRKLGAGGLQVARPMLAVERQESESHDFVWHHLLVSLENPGRPPSPLYPTVVMHDRRPRGRFYPDWYWWGAAASGSGAETEADVRWCATLHPPDLDPYFLEGLVRIANNLDWWEARWEQRAFLEPLLGLPTKLSDLAIRLLALALGAKEPGIRGVAADATDQALADGRLRPQALGAALGDAWSSPLVTPRRYALSLAAAAATSAHVRALVREAMALGLRAKPHTDAAQILELLHELCHAHRVGVEDPDARSSLASYTSGKAGRLAKSLLAMSDPGGREPTSV